VNRKIFALAMIGVLAVLIAGCGSDSGTSGGAYGGGETSGDTTAGGGGYGGKSASHNSASDADGGADGVVSAAKVGDLGMILVTTEGLTLYDFHKDKGGTSSCYGACAGAWPPLLTEGNPQAQGPANRSMLGTTKRKEGTLQVTYNGWPLYTYAGDKAPGEANGNDIDQFGAEWYALQPNGEEPED
jgi:predicted lipoprotein with Yx(FWY)xxD motif